MTLCVRSKQPRTIKTIIYSDIFTSLRRIKVQSLAVQGIVQSGLLLLCTELTLFCIELPENCVCLNQSELSNFFHLCYYGGYDMQKILKTTKCFENPKRRAGDILVSYVNNLVQHNFLFLVSTWSGCEERVPPELGYPEKSYFQNLFPICNVSFETVRLLCVLSRGECTHNSFFTYIISWNWN